MGNLYLEHLWRLIGSGVPITIDLCERELELLFDTLSKLIFECAAVLRTEDLDLWAALITTLTALAHHLSQLLRLVELFDLLSVFPGRIRPPCTTMPWTVWPALVVLWGVCWMFYPSANTQIDVDGGPPFFAEGSDQAIGAGKQRSLRVAKQC